MELKDRRFMKVKISKLKFFSIYLLFILNYAYSQNQNTLFFLKEIPQNYFINPAFKNDSKFFIGFPGLTPFNLRLENSAFSIKDVLKYDESIDSLITFLHPNADPDAFLSLLKDKNTISADVGTSLISIGFQTRGTHFSFDLSQRAFSKIFYPDDLLKLPVYGNDSIMFFDFNNLAVHASVWTEIGMRVAFQLTDNLQIGWRPKFLFGQAAFSTNLFNVTLGTGDEVWPVHSQIKMDMCAPFLNVNYNDEGMIDFDRLEFKEINRFREMSNTLFNGGNMGFSMDLGADFQVNEKLQISASIIDMGNIKWRKGVYNLQNNASYEFRGMEIDLESENILKSLGDSLKQIFRFTADEKYFTTFLPTKIYAGFTVYPHQAIGLGILSGTAIFSGDLRQQFTFSANYSPSRIFNAAMSYTLANGYFKNIGLGFSFSPGPFNIYLISDTGPSAIFRPYNLRNLNLQLGMNFVFRDKNKRKYLY